MRKMSEKKTEASAGRKLELDPVKAEAAKRRRAYQLHVVEIPYLRLIGFGLLSLCIYLHNRFIFGHVSWKEIGFFVCFTFIYSLLSWGALYLFFDRTTKVNLGVVFLTTDLAILLSAIYLTGGDRSLLFLLLLVRVSDQANTTFRKALFFSHVPAFGYLMMLWYLASMEGREIPWTAEGIKVSLLYLTSVYISLTARTAENIRKRTGSAMQLARDLISKLDEAKKRALEGSRAKSEFIANMSHEFRTPLNHIIGFTEMVADKKVGNLSETQEEYLNDVLKSSRHLLSLINDVLDLSKVEAGKLDLESGQVNLRELLEHSVGMISEKAMERRIRVEKVLHEIPALIDADERKLRQVMYNLLSNAVKFTPENGTIAVTGRIVGLFDSVPGNGGMKKTHPGRGNLPQGESFPSDRGKFVEISVSDNGIGLKPGDLDRIFEPFEQVESTASRRFQGTGLGLSLTRRLVELHGGRIWAESEGEGKGSRFRFLIPLNLYME
jgi:signal transduction histidine kinase